MRCVVFHSRSGWLSAAEPPARRSLTLRGAKTSSLTDPELRHSVLSAMTTILAIHKNGISVLGGDGQVTLGDQIQKHNAVKVRTLQNGQVLAGFAGGAADAMTLVERFEEKLEEHAGQLRKAAVELARDWRTDRVLRRLEAVMVVADREELLLVSGTGDVIAPDDGVLATGSGGGLAAAAARALMTFSSLSLGEICTEALRIAGHMDLHTNDRLTVLEVGEKQS